MLDKTDLESPVLRLWRRPVGVVRCPSRFVDRADRRQDQGMRDGEVCPG